MRSTLLPALLLLVLAEPDARSTTAGGSVTGVVYAFDDNGKRVNRDELWVYLERPHDRHHQTTAAPPPREIRQQNRQFVPHVLVVPVGTTVSFPNYDREEHNVFSPTDPGQFDVGRYNTDKKGKSHEFDDAYEMEIFCDIHREMSAYVKVVDADAALIAKVGPDGRFVITGVPAGTYTVHAWTYASVESLDTVTVADGVTAIVPELHVELGKPKLHRRKDGSPYPLYPK